MKAILPLVVGILTAISIQAQSPFPELCEGSWKGEMYWFQDGTVRDTILVHMEVASIADTAGWTWKTVYESPDMTITKDYRIFQKGPGNHEFILDEGDGILLESYAFGNKLYGLFELQGTFFNSCYTLEGDRLIFEITSAIPGDSTGEDIRNYRIGMLQLSVLTRD